VSTITSNETFRKTSFAIKLFVYLGPKCFPENARKKGNGSRKITNVSVGLFTTISDNARARFRDKLTFRTRFDIPVFRYCLLRSNSVVVHHSTFCRREFDFSCTLHVIDEHNGATLQTCRVRTISLVIVNLFLSFRTIP